MNQPAKPPFWRRPAGEIGLVLILLMVMIGLMLRPIADESATLDEPVFLAAGYTYLTGYGYWLDPEQPPLAKELSALPLLRCDVQFSPIARRLLNPKTGFPKSRDWNYVLQDVTRLFPNGRVNWYYWPGLEANAFGNAVMYDGTNNALELLVWGRFMQVLLTLLTGLAIYFWVRQLAGQAAAFLGLILWVFNPIALGYGHLILTDMGITLGMVLSVWMFSRFLRQPTIRTACCLGVATGIAFLMKITAVLLPPMLLVTALIGWLADPALRQQSRRFWKLLPLVMAITWMILLLGYFPAWKAAPPLAPEEAARIGVPTWFQTLRPLLIPSDYFKGIAVQTGHSSTGHPCYLFGQWRDDGWWYYYPVALAIKSPLPWLLGLGIGLGTAIAWRRKFAFARWTPWIAAAVYLAFAMHSKINIGVRHLFPLIALVTVAMAAQFAAARPWLRWTGIFLAGWMILVAVQSYPFHIQYFNELAGGPANGWRLLADSNLDWGQDIKRLQSYLADHQLDNVSVDLFGANVEVDHYLPDAARITAAEAKTLHQGVLVVSASRLVSPAWQWLRESRQPMACVAYTQFIYEMGDQPSTSGTQ